MVLSCRITIITILCIGREVCMQSLYLRKERMIKHTDIVYLIFEKTTVWIKKKRKTKWICNWLWQPCVQCKKTCKRINKQYWGLTGFYLMAGSVAQTDVGLAVDGLHVWLNLCHLKSETCIHVIWDYIQVRLHTCTYYMYMLVYV